MDGQGGRPLGFLATSTEGATWGAEKRSLEKTDG
jgi:hypothetical protein